VNTTSIHSLAERMHPLEMFQYGFGEKMGKTFHILVFAFLLAFTSLQKAHAENGEVLFGAAAITGAVSAMVAPAIMAQAQQNIAQTNAQTSTTISQINSQQALFQARLQAQTTLANAASSMQIASYNQQSQTRDLLSQLQFLAYKRALDYQLSQFRLAQEMEMQNNLMALEMKKQELSQVLAESQQLARMGAPVTTTPNLNNLGTLNAAATNPLSGTLGANAQLNSARSGIGAASSSMSLRRALTASVSTGSTQNGRRFVNRDLTNLINSTVVDATTVDNGAYRRHNTVSHSRSLASHHQR